MRIARASVTLRLSEGRGCLHTLPSEATKRNLTQKSPYYTCSLRADLGTGFSLQLTLQVGHSLLDSLLVQSLVLILKCEAQSV